MGFLRFLKGIHFYYIEKVIFSIIAIYSIQSAEAQFLKLNDSTGSINMNATVPDNYVFYVYRDGKHLQTFTEHDIVLLTTLQPRPATDSITLKCFKRKCATNLPDKTKCFTCVKR